MEWAQTEIMYSEERCGEKRVGLGHPTIKLFQTEISSYAVSIRTHLRIDDYVWSQTV